MLVKKERKEKESGISLPIERIQLTPLYHKINKIKSQNK